MPLVAVLLFLAVAAPQLLAMTAGVHAWLGLPWLVAAPVALVVACMPGIGVVASFMATTELWGWTWWQAGLLAASPLAIVVILRGPLVRFVTVKLSFSGAILRFLQRYSDVL